MRWSRQKDGQKEKAKLSRGYRELWNTNEVACNTFRQYTTKHGSMHRELRNTHEFLCLKYLICRAVATKIPNVPPHTTTSKAAGFSGPRGVSLSVTYVGAGPASAPTFMFRSAVHPASARSKPFFRNDVRAQGLHKREARSKKEERD